MPLRPVEGYGSAGAVRITATGKGVGTSSQSSSGSFDIGDKVEANYKRTGKFYRGKIMKVNDQYSYKIIYDDGDMEDKVEPERIKLI